MQKSALIGMLAFALGVFVISACVATPDPTEASPIPKSDLALGGMMYDNWMKVIGVDVPEGEPPLWKTQTTNTLLARMHGAARSATAGIIKALRVLIVLARIEPASRI